MTWVIFDFAGVIGRHQPQEDQDAMVTAVGVLPDCFWDAYWGQRESYDANKVSASGYWSAVLTACGGQPTPERIDRLVRLDVASWLHPDPGTVALLDDLATRGIPMALLSNCPLELAEALGQLSWLGRLARQFYSSHLSLVKPDPAIYQTVARELGVDSEDCVFVDDRIGNVKGAEEVGMRGVAFTDATSLKEDLYRLLDLN